MLRVLLYIFLIYLVYQFVFKFLIPLYNTTQQLRKGFHEMNNRMNANGEPHDSSPQQPRQNNSTPSEKVGEYIDFEEIK
jgi:hypothetical protein